MSWKDPNWTLSKSPTILDGNNYPFNPQTKPPECQMENDDSHIRCHFFPSWENQGYRTGAQSS